MGFIDDIKEDQKMQIQAVCVVFFLLAFPSYFFLKAAATDDPSGMGGVGTYSVTGDLSYIDFDTLVKKRLPMVTPFVLDLNTDALSSEDQGKNIVGVLVSMSYSEDEETGNTPGCLGVPNSTKRPRYDFRNCHTSRIRELADGQNQGGGGSHDVTAEWYNSSIIGTEVEGLSESEISRSTRLERRRIGRLHNRNFSHCKRRK